MRPLNEIKVDVRKAVDLTDPQRLYALADELREIGTSEARIIAANCDSIGLRQEGKFADAIAVLERALHIYDEDPSIVNDGGIALNLANVYTGIGSMAEALRWYEKCLASAEKLGYKDLMGRVTVSIGVIHRDLGSPVDALEWLNRAVGILDDCGDNGGLARAYNSLGLVYSNTASYIESVQYFERALALYEQLGDMYNAASVTSDIGNVYLILKNYPEALQWFQRAQTLFEGCEVQSGLIAVFANIGDVHYETNDKNEALRYYRMAADIEKKYPNRVDTLSIYSALCTTLLDLGMIDEAREVFELRFNTPSEFPTNIILRHQFRSRLHTLDGELAAASSELNQALDVAKERGMRSHQADTHKLLRDLAQQRNDFASYIEHNNAYLQLDEEVRGKETTLKLALHTKEKEMSAERGVRERERALLYGALPKHIADRMINGDSVSGDHFDNSAVLFLDVVGFTSISDSLSPMEVIQLLESVFAALDKICGHYNVTKIKTIGDSYMAVAGVT